MAESPIKPQDEPQQDESSLKDSWEEAGKAQAADLDTANLPPDVTVACAISLFLRTLKGQSAQTHKTYRVGCRVFMLFLYEKKLGNPAEIQVTSLAPLILEDYYLWLVDKYSRSKKATVAGYMAGPRNLFSFLARREVTPQGVQYAKMTGGLAKLVGRSGYKTPRVDFSETRKLAEFVYGLRVPPLPTSPDSHKTALEASETCSPELTHLYVAKRRLSQREMAQKRLEVLRDRAIILTLYTTGMRREEVAKLNRADVRDGRADEALITGKGDKERVVFFDEPTLAAIQKYLAERDDKYQPLFIQHGVNRPKAEGRGDNLRLSVFGIWAIVQKWAKVIKVRVKPHDFRHGLATSMLNSGAQLSEVQDVLGHASPVTTKMIYAHYERKTLRAAIEKHRTSVATLNQSPKDN